LVAIAYIIVEKAIAPPSHSAQVTRIAHSRKTDAIAFFRFSRKMIAFSSHSAQVETSVNLSPMNAIAFFRFSPRIIAFSSHSAQVTAIAPKKRMI
jgi:hypothetical protein